MIYFLYKSILLPAAKLRVVKIWILRMILPEELQIR